MPGCGRIRIVPNILIGCRTSASNQYWSIPGLEALFCLSYGEIIGWI